MSIPVIDFSAFSLTEDDVSEEQMCSLSSQMKTAFTDVGFVFLKNTGITHEEVERVLDASKKFFLQPDEKKQPFSRRSFSINENHGWVSCEIERLNPNRPGDLKESYNICSVLPDIKWPSAEFQELHASSFLRCQELSLRVLTVMAHSLDLDPDVFLSAHRFVGTDRNSSVLRPLYYPPVDSEKVKKDQVRCGEHSDYGSISMLFQRNEGLQVLSRSGEYINVPVIPGAVLINIADLMQRWTSDQFISVRHRVLLPPAGDSCTRQCLAFFLQPDDEAVITCLDGSNKYPPVTGYDYLLKRLQASYDQF